MRRHGAYRPLVKPDRCQAAHCRPSKTNHLLTAAGGEKNSSAGDPAGTGGSVARALEVGRALPRGLPVPASWSRHLQCAHTQPQLSYVYLPIRPRSLSPSVSCSAHCDSSALCPNAFADIRRNTHCSHAHRIPSCRVSAFALPFLAHCAPRSWVWHSADCRLPPRRTQRCPQAWDPR